MRQITRTFCFMKSVYFLILIQCECFMVVWLIEWKCGSALFSSVQGKWGGKEGKIGFRTKSDVVWKGGGDGIYLLHYIKLGLNSLLLLSNRFSSVLSNKGSVWQIAPAKTGMWEESPKFCFNLNFLEVLQIENSEPGREITIYELQFHYLGWQGSQYSVLGAQFMCS